MKVLTNVGLEGHGISAGSIRAILRNLLRDGNRLVSDRVVKSDGGDWEPEYIVVHEIQVVSWCSLDETLATLCGCLGEDAIAYLPVFDDARPIDNGYISWNPRYTGERFEFNHDYFTK